MLRSSTGWDSLNLTRLLWEHKRCMLERIKYMELHKYLDASRRYSEEYALIEATASKIRLDVLRSFRRRKRSDRSRQETSGKKVVGWMWEIAESENRILRWVLDGLVARPEVELGNTVPQ